MVSNKKELPNVWRLLVNYVFGRLVGTQIDVGTIQRGHFGFKMRCMLMEAKINTFSRNHFNNCEGPQCLVGWYVQAPCQCSFYKANLLILEILLYPNIGTLSIISQDNISNGIC
jgi:hypothetical protein